MADFRLTAAAEADIVEILSWSQAQFGDAARRRYERLIIAALMDVGEEPARRGSAARPELGLGAGAGIFAGAASARAAKTGSSNAQGTSSSTDRPMRD